MGHRHFIVLVALILLSGCGEKTASLCGASGGSCCKTTDRTGKTAGTICLKTYDECQKAAPAGGSFVWQYTSNDKKDKDAGYCERQTRNVPFWSEDPFVYLVRAALKPAMPRSITSAQGNTIAQGDAEYCRALCLTGDAGLCPVLPLRSDVSLSTLMLMQRVAENPPKTTYVYPVEQIMDDFRVSADTNLCKRGDLLVTPTSSINVAPSECNSQIQQISSLGDIDVELISAKNLISTFIADKKIASYDIKNSAFSLKVNDASYSPYYSGNIRYTGRMTATKIFAQIDASKQMSCGALVPIVDQEYDLEDLSNAVEKDPTLPGAALRALAAYRASVLRGRTKVVEDDVNNIKTDDDLLHYGAYLSALKNVAVKHGVNAPSPKTVEGDSDKSRTLEGLLRLIDVHMCSKTLEKTPVEQLLPLIPMATKNNIDLDLLDRREAIAGAILQCKYSAEYISPHAGEIIGLTVQNAAPKQ
jgi:hypothetical protein